MTFLAKPEKETMEVLRLKDPVMNKAINVLGELSRAPETVTIAELRMKNNKRTCVLITPEIYQEMMETIENYKLALEADKRMRSVADSDFISSDDVLKELGITKDELNKIEVNIE